jgi:predicted TPR repeat methyltransferase
MIPASRSGIADPETRTRRAGGYETARPDVQFHVPESARCILEFGCSTGALGAAIKRRQEARVVGVEITAEYAAQAAHRLDRVIALDIETFLDGPPPDEAPFDCLVAADVLEHLVDPWSVLARAADLLAPGATVIISVPNVLYWPAIWQVLRSGRWPREDAGTFDRTHLRWFTRADALELVASAGLTAIRVEPRYWTEGWRLWKRQMLGHTFLQQFLAGQFIVVATAR